MGPMLLLHKVHEPDRSRESRSLGGRPASRQDDYPPRKWRKNQARPVSPLWLDHSLIVLVQEPQGVRPLQICPRTIGQLLLSDLPDHYCLDD
jgi:hypothetical protein